MAKKQLDRKDYNKAFAKELKRLNPAQKEAVEQIRNMADVLEKEKVALEDNIETLTMYASR